MKTLVCSIMLIGSIGIANAAFGQGRSGGAGPSSGPAAGVQRGPSTPPPNSTPSPTKGGPSDTSKGTSSGKGLNSDHGSTNKVGSEISDHPALGSKLQSLLPAGTNMDDASAGFKNLGQFVAAVHVAKNLNIPFDQLKDKMVTGNESLGAAIHELKPAVTKDAANIEAKKAEAQAKEDTKKSS